MNKKNKSIRVKPSKMKNENKVTIELSDELTIHTIETIKDVMMENIKKYESVEINGTNIKNIDLTFLQLMYSMQITCKTEGKSLVLNINNNKENQTLLDNTDTSRVIKN